MWNWVLLWRQMNKWSDPTAGSKDTQVWEQRFRITTYSTQLWLKGDKGKLCMAFVDFRKYFDTLDTEKNSWRLSGSTLIQLILKQAVGYASIYIAWKLQHHNPISFILIIRSHISCSVFQSSSLNTHRPNGAFNTLRKSAYFRGDFFRPNLHPRIFLPRKCTSADLRYFQPKSYSSKFRVQNKRVNQLHMSQGTYHGSGEQPAASPL